jgi:pimeloyl-ACP methyl ester carboxylesterase
MRTVHTLFVHGVGFETPASFAAGAAKRLTGTLTSRLVGSYHQAVHWGPVLDGPQRAMLVRVKKAGSKANLGQRIASGVAADALSYQQYPNELNAVFDLAYARLRAPDEVVIVAHSLGCVLTADWLRARPSVKVRKFITIGNNMEEFMQGRTASFACPHQLAAKGVWQNVFYPTDGLGYPISDWAPAMDHVESVPFWALSTFIPFLSHVDYWHDKSLFAETVPNLLAE